MLKTRSNFPKTILLGCMLGLAHAGNALAITYGYDDLGRLIHVNYDNGTRIDYQYDNNGNLLSRIITPDAFGDNDNDMIVNHEDPDDDNDNMSDLYEINNQLNHLSATDAQLDPDNDGLKNVDEASANSLAQNPDTDNDNIRDGLDRLPTQASNECSGLNANLANITIGNAELVTCAAGQSIELQNNVLVRNGGELELISPAISADNGLEIESGGLFNIQTTDPRPLP